MRSTTGPSNSPFYAANRHDALTNGNFRTALFTTQRTQLVKMTVRPGESLGREQHPDTDQIFVYISGGAPGVLRLGTPPQEFDFSAQNPVAVVQAGTYHDLANPSDTNPLHLYTIYVPPHHPSNTAQATNPEGPVYE